MPAAAKANPVFALVKNVARKALFLKHQITGPKIKAQVLNPKSDFGIAILVSNPRAKQLEELVKRFESDGRVCFVSWGPLEPEKSKARGRWVFSRANCIGSAANAGLAELCSKTVLVVGQEFNLMPEDVDKIANAASPVATTFVVTKGETLIASAGLARVNRFSPYRNQLAGYNIVDLPDDDWAEQPELLHPIVKVDGKTAFKTSGDRLLFAEPQQLRINYRIRIALPVNATIASSLLKISNPNHGNQLKPKTDRPRWAIKNPASAGKAGNLWGDTFYARDLAEALNAQGQLAFEDRFENWYRPTSKIDQVQLVIRGPRAYRPNSRGTSVLWVISNPEKVTVKEVRQFDYVFAASKSWAERMTKESGKTIHPLYQATNSKRFHAGPATPGLTAELLFIGQARPQIREVVDFAIKSEAPLTLYGPDWREQIDPRYIKADFMPNEQLPAAYRSSEIVLNDHTPSMKKDGFVSNRVLDAAACGARVLSDEVEGIGELVGALVQTYKDFDSFKKLVGSKRAWPSDAERKKLAAQVVAEHSFEARAKTLISAVRPA